jgi:hypothetical protein
VDWINLAQLALVTTVMNLRVREISGSHGGEYEDGWLSSGLLRRVVW